MMRIALGIEYKCTYCHHWQQPEQHSTIQIHLQAAFTKVADHPVEVICAGRTDRGVHALGQVAHFDTSAERDNYAWVMGANTHLPADIKVLWAQPVDENFHARYSATARRYSY